MRKLGLFATVILVTAALSVIAAGCGNSAKPTTLLTPTPTISSTPTPTVTPELGVKFIHTATVANTILNWTVIDNPLTNDNPDAILLVTPNWNPGDIGGTYNNYSIGVWYDGSKWAIFNQDQSAMPVDASFNVLIPAAGTATFVHTATVANTISNWTDIDNVLTNNNPNAIVIVTPNWNPGGVGDTYDNSPIGVWYDDSVQKWAIFNQDITDMPVNASFNVLIPAAGTATFIHTATTANTILNWTDIDNSNTNNDLDAIVLVTPNWNPGNVGGTYNNHPIGVWYDDSVQQWSIFNQDLTDMPVNAAFNVLIP